GVQPGAFNLSGRRVFFTGGVVSIVAPPTPTLHRISLVYLDSNGNLLVANGTETFYSAAAPSFEGRFPVATIQVTNGDVTLAPDRRGATRGPERVQRHRHQSGNGGRLERRRDPLRAALHRHHRRAHPALGLARRAESLRHRRRRPRLRLRLQLRRRAGHRGGG